MLCSCSVLNEWIFIIPVNTPTQICASIAIKKDEGWLAFATTLYPGSISKWVSERSQPVWWYTNELFFKKVQIVPWSLPDFEAPHWNSRITKSPPPANSEFASFFSSVWKQNQGHLMWTNLHVHTNNFPAVLSYPVMFLALMLLSETWVHESSALSGLLPSAPFGVNLCLEKRISSSQLCMPACQDGAD